MRKNRVSEATGSGNAGNFKIPIVLSPQPWTKDQVAPFTDSVYSYDNAELAYQEADGDFKETPEKRAQIEKRTDKISQVNKYLKSFYTGQNDEDGGVIGDIEESAINEGGVDGSWLAITLGLVGGPLRRQGEEYVVNAVAVHISGSADAPQGEDWSFWRRCNPDGALWIEVIIVAVAVEITKGCCGVECKVSRWRGWWCGAPANSI